MTNREFYTLCDFTIDQMLADYRRQTKDSYDFTKPDFEEFMQAERAGEAHVEAGDIVQDSSDTLVVTDVQNSSLEHSVVYYVLSNIFDEPLNIDKVQVVALHKCLIPVFEDPMIHRYVKIGKCEDEFLGKLRARGKIVDDDYLLRGFNEQAEIA